MVDQSPLARTPRSTPILYLGLYDRVRELFAAQPEAMAQGLTASAFSFNSGSGRCERCCGTGFEKIEMQFLSDLYVRCAECEGRRFQPHVLKVQGARQIDSRRPRADRDAKRSNFSPRSAKQKRWRDPLDVLEEVGLGYLRLGQPLNTLSGGESQRFKLVRHLTDTSERASELERQGAGNLFIFDEPTTGLHFDDVAHAVEAVSASGRAGQFHRRDRTQSGGDQMRRLDHRSRAGSRRRRRRNRRRRHAGANGKGRRRRTPDDFCATSLGSARSLACSSRPRSTARPRMKCS